MPRIQLPDELWVVILPYLRNPIPKPLSRPSRAALRQPHLASASRVSKLFESICQKLLYKHLVSDDLAKVFANISSPSMQRRLNLTQTLNLEYMPASQDYTYKMLLSGIEGAWQRIGRSPNKTDRTVMAECQMEIKGMLPVLTKAMSIGMKAIFPNLETLALGSIYGQESYRWLEYEYKLAAEDPYNRNPINVRCTQLFCSFLAKGNLQHICLRDVNGPLSFPPMSIASQRDYTYAEYSKTVHFGENFGHLPLSVGQPMRWISDFKPNDNWAPVLRDLAEAFSNLMEHRRDILDQQGRHKDTIDLDVFCSTTYFDTEDIGGSDGGADPFGIDLTLHLMRSDSNGTGLGDFCDVRENEEEWILAHVASEMQNHFREDCNAEDEIRFHSSRDTPVCLACGSGAPG